MITKKQQIVHISCSLLVLMCTLQRVMRRAFNSIILLLFFNWLMPTNASDETSLNRKYELHFSLFLAERNEKMSAFWEGLGHFSI